MFACKSLDTLHSEMEGENRLHRVLGPISLTSLGVGAIIGAGIFAMTGRTASNDAGPAVVVSFLVAGIGCAFAAMCYAEFASMVPVAGSAYTYAYATLGELVAWIIGWDLVLEYAMSCTVVAAHWAHYLEEFLLSTTGWQIPPQLMSDPFTPVQVQGQDVATWLNLPAVLIMIVITAILVRGIRESVMTNAILVVVKLTVVLFVIGLGVGYVNTKNWTDIPISERKVGDIKDYLERHPEIKQRISQDEVAAIHDGQDLLKKYPDIAQSVSRVELLKIKKLESEVSKWGLLSLLGIKQWLIPIDDKVRSSFAPYGFSGIMLGAAIVFFAYIGFDSISTHAEEAKHPQRDVPIGIFASLAVCTLLYILVSAVLTGMDPYPTIDTEAAVASAFRRRGEVEHSWALRAASGFIATGALAGMTSVLLVTFLSQARIFLAMSRDGLLPPAIFAAVHPRFRTPHRSTILTGLLICLLAAVTPIRALEEMVNIGTLMAFVIVCAAVLILRIRHPEARRPFRCPALWIIAPAGVLVNLILMLFLPLDTWLRLVGWLVLGLVVYFLYGFRHSALRKRLQQESNSA